MKRAVPKDVPRDEGDYDVTRYVPPHVTAILWGRAAGRCEFAGCNRPVSWSLVTQRELNIAQRAHIRSFSRRGPRGRQGLSKELLNSASNLMLVCHQCHVDIDSGEGPRLYPSEMLIQMKRKHEERVELVTGIAADSSSHILLYGSNIGDQSPHLSFKQAATAMMPGRFPASRNPFMLQMSNVALSDVEQTFWANEDENLKRLFENRVREPLLELGVERHLSVFALAAQPLLVRLGTLLGDIAEVDVFQRHRAPQTWNWPDSAEPLKFEVVEPSNGSGTPALLVDISGRVTEDRIYRVLGEGASIWRLTVASPHNDILKSRDHLAAFRAAARPLFSAIKEKHGQNTPLHVFLAAPVSVCVELGRVRMPKADMPWLLYDHHNVHGFKSVLNIA
ncbi:SAVED domain-containing protein [Edaphobacter flagellatus]|uniref:SAVED domain-containing protein n=1 Tax=Edaphobacter flagellatus TaxID=1933044 RepID=UPI0021B2E664|nr:SAVED domain-containing protein [Edaphobacter flagellatus]